MTKNILSRTQAREQAIKLAMKKWEEDNREWSPPTHCNYTYSTTKEDARNNNLRRKREDWDEEYDALENKIITAIEVFNKCDISYPAEIEMMFGNELVPQLITLRDILLRNLNEDILKLTKMLEEIK